LSSYAITLLIHVPSQKDDKPANPILKALAVEQHHSLSGLLYNSQSLQDSFRWIVIFFDGER
jgi:hypothetical protein